MTCSMPGCVRPAKARGLCGMHWKRQRRSEIPRSYATWVDIRGRCLNPKHRVYHRYGGRGIGIDPRWMDFSGFFGDMGDHPAGYVLHRKDHSGPYCKSNCVWMVRADHIRLHAAMRASRRLELAGVAS